MNRLLQSRLLALTITILGSAGCRGPGDARSTQLQGDTQLPPEKPLIGNPLLTTNDVLAIARQSASRLRFRLDGYVCDRPFLAYRTKTNQWIVHFRRDPPVPDDELYVIIDDASREAKTFQP
jgi:hypothetical protein